MSKKNRIVFEELNEEELQDMLYSEFVPFSEELDVYKDYIIKTLMDLIGKEISKLPETQRDVIYAYFFSEKTFKEIGKDFGVTEDAVRLRKHRAIMTLKKQLANNPYVEKLYKQFKESDPPIELIVRISQILKK